MLQRRRRGRDELRRRLQRHAAGREPHVPEVCNGLDDDCDGSTDEGVLRTFYVDADGDTYGEDDPATNMQACFTPTGYAERAGTATTRKSRCTPACPTSATR
ncbi:MAG: MopE-related protein [Sandaracinaceae bacterium]|nr:MopE-related protein [Sandaracinaceae bacterium]